jgi:hypothetical protein
MPHSSTTIISYLKETCAMFYAVGKLHIIFIYTQKVGMKKNYQSGEITSCS